MKFIPARRQFARNALAIASMAAPASGAPAVPAPGTGGGAPGLAALPAAPIGDAERHSRDEHYWSQVAAQYDLAPDPINLDNGYYGAMARPVLQAYQHNVVLLNRGNSVLLREHYDTDGALAIRARIAAVAGVAPEEIALTRGATEALQNLIVNYQRLRPGDRVLYSDLDYDSMQYAMDALEERRGVEVVRIAIPEPASHANIVDCYARAMAAQPRLKLMLLTHVSHRTGLVLPVAEIARMARARGIDVIVDAAHSWGQLDFALPELEADFIGCNLHKWIGAPLGVGFMYIRKARLADIGVHLADRDYDGDDIRARVHSGTTNTANVMTVPAALAFHEQLGAANKAARLRYLSHYWVSQVRGLDGLRILTPDEPGMACALTALRLAGQGGKQANLALVRRLRERYGIFTVRRGGVAQGDCVRVTVALHTSTAQLDRLVLALRAVARG
jgi:isopenicillin-N epimerase